MVANEPRTARKLATRITMPVEPSPFVGARGPHAPNLVACVATKGILKKPATLVKLGEKCQHPGLHVQCEQRPTILKRQPAQL
jgi:hypothetical protein